MTRREGLLALVAVVERAMAGDQSALAQSPSGWTTTAQSGLTTARRLPTIEINLDDFGSWNVHYKGRTVTITPQELFAALAADAK